MPSLLSQFAPSLSSREGDGAAGGSCEVSFGDESSRGVIDWKRGWTEGGMGICGAGTAFVAGFGLGANLSAALATAGSSAAVLSGVAAVLKIDGGIDGTAEGISGALGVEVVD